MTDRNTNSWRLTGLIATVIILLSVPLYVVKERASSRLSANDTSALAATFVGSQKCESCHKQEYDKWRDSHHRRAMAPATSETVRGDFNNVAFERFGVTTRFYRRDGKFFVYTAGPGGNPAEFEITHTFGWYPLQQYLVPFPGGRLQCLPIAWDIQKKRWYQLPPDQPLDPSDWLYWTNHGQNWNGMCAECHSTDLKKNYSPDADSYHTTWSEISVGCEACHGPGSEHVKWAEMPEMGRPATPNDALVVRTSGLSARQQIELCAPCHSRRMSLGDNLHRNVDFMDYGIPQLLTEGYYFPDGQILEEVYVYGSFMQSKMYARYVRCSDCHDVHSIKRIKEGNSLCLQCHKAAVYDTTDHHFHKKKGEKGEPVKSKTGEILFDVGSGAQCEQCHMPGRFYMGIDYRPDHSFRIPRPDLSLTIGTPNACNRCHADKSIQWSVDSVAKWYGQRKRPHYGTILEAGRHGKPEAIQDLIRLSDDRLYPTIVRATALSSLAGYSGADSLQAFERALSDEEALMRYTALRNLPVTDAAQRLHLVGPLLYDPVKAVRIEAAQNLASVAPDRMPPLLRQRFIPVLSEYRRAMEYTADFAPSRHNLGNLYAEIGEDDLAIENYRKAIAIDDQFYPAKVNLAMLYNRQGNNDQAEKLLRQVVAAHPDLYEVKYSLGLLLAEEKKYEAAAVYLREASDNLPQRSRVHYNLGLLLQQLNRDAEAEAALKKALEVEPDQPDYLYALALFYLKTQRLQDARRMAEQLVVKHPSWSAGQELLTLIQRQASTEPGN
jgi:Tfp pilus assembly protein PilF